MKKSSLCAVLAVLTAVFLTALPSHAETTNSAQHVFLPITNSVKALLAPAPQKVDARYLPATEREADYFRLPFQDRMDFSSQTTWAGRRFGSDFFRLDVYRRKSLSVGVVILSEYPLQVGPDKDFQLVGASISRRFR